MQKMEPMNYQSNQNCNCPLSRKLLLTLTLAMASTSQLTQAQNTNRVLAYTNTGYVSIPSSAKLQNPTEMTVEAWVLPVNDSGLLIAKSDGLNVSSDRSYELGSGPNGFGVSFFLGSSVWAGCRTTNLSGFTGRWTHVAATFSSSSGLICLYLNGVLAASATNDWGGTIPLAGLTVRQSSQPLVLGYDYPVTTSGITGLMDEVRVWSVVRTAADIQGTMYQRLAGTEPGLQGYWNFDTGTAADGTPNHLDGTFHNGATTIADNVSLAVQISIAAVAISFSTASPLTSYQVQSATNLPSTNWINVGNPILGNGQVQSVTDPVFGQPKKFYRVIFY